MSEEDKEFFDRDQFAMESMSTTNEIGKNSGLTYAETLVAERMCLDAMDAALKAAEKFGDLIAANRRTLVIKTAANMILAFSEAACAKFAS